MPEQENSITDIKKFFEMSIKEFKAEWDQLSEEEKNWFKAQPLPKD